MNSGLPGAIADVLLEVVESLPCGAVPYAVRPKQPASVMTTMAKKRCDSGFVSSKEFISDR
jgi:hypothetical protein